MVGAPVKEDLVNDGWTGFQNPFEYVILRRRNGVLVCGLSWDPLTGTSTG